MTRYNFKFTAVKVSETAEFADASLNELRVIQVLFDMGGSASEDELIERSGISKARLASSLAFWQEAGVIVPSEEETIYGNKITEEFPERVIIGEPMEESASEIAATIRSHKLASLFDEIAAMMKKTMLTPMEMKNIAILCSQYSLNEEYIATLAAHLHGKGSLTVRNLTARCKKLVDNGVNTVEELETSIAADEHARQDLIRYKIIFGVNNRAFSKKEREYIDKWSKTYGYGTEIIEMAYGVETLNTGEISFRYMDTLLTDWYESGCRTLLDCEKRCEAVRIMRENEAKDKKAASAPVRKEKKKESPRYGDFDPEEAFRLALERSYPSEKSSADN